MPIRIHPTAEVSDKARIGDGTSIWLHVQIRENVSIGENCIIGKGVYIDAGVSVQKIRKSVHALQALLPQVGRPLSELVLVATGDVVLVFQGGTVFEAISGQEWVFEVADFEQEVTAYRARNGAGASRSSAAKTAPADQATHCAQEPARPGPVATRRPREDWSQTG